jgi:hypothetical protein
MNSAEPRSIQESSDQTRAQEEAKLGASVKQIGVDISLLRNEMSEIRVAQDSLNESLKKILEQLEAIEEKL